MKLIFTLFLFLCVSIASAAPGEIELTISLTPAQTVCISNQAAARGMTTEQLLESELRGGVTNLTRRCISERKEDVVRKFNQASPAKQQAVIDLLNNQSSAAPPKSK